MDVPFALICPLNMRKYITSFLFYSMVSWFLGCIGYMLLVPIMPGGAVFGSWYRMFLYHYRHPYQYILVVALTYGLFATVWSRYLGHLNGWKRAVGIGAVILFTLIFASVPGGVLWGIHDIQAGFVPPLPILRHNLIWAGKAGLTFGWVIIALSIPYNIIGFFTGYFLTHFGQRFLEKRVWGQQSFPAPAARR